MEYTRNWTAEGRTITCAPNGSIIATTNRHPFADGVGEANAHLIAACPDMYEALKELKDWLKSDGVQVLGEGLYEQMTIPKTFEKVDKALAKADNKT